MNLHITASEHATEPTRITITIPTNVYFLSGIRNFTTDIVKNVAGFDDQWVHRMQTVVDELTNNAIEHGSGPHDTVTLTFAIERQQWVEITVVDGGHGRHHFTAADLNHLIEHAREHAAEPSLALRGRGFRIIANWSDSFAFADTLDGGIAATVRKTYEEPSFTPQPMSAMAEDHAGVYILEV